MRMTKAAHYPGITALTPAQSLTAQWRRVFLLPLALVLLASCGGGSKGVRNAAPPSESRDWSVIAPANPAASNSVLMRAISLVGTPYKWGGNTPQSGFDCSGLVNFVYQDMLQIDLPRSSSALAAYQGPRIKPGQLTAGDLVFFGSGGQVSHVGIYVGNGRFVHAPSSGGTVRLDHLDGYYWRDHYTGAKRVVQ